MRAYSPMLMLLLASAATRAAATEPSAPYLNGCDWPDLMSMHVPSADGPARLEGIDCPTWAGMPIPSPDGQRFLSQRSESGLSVSVRDHGKIIATYPFDATFKQFSGMSLAPRLSDFLYRWGSDSRSIWAADQERGPGGFATGPLKPVLIRSDGTQQVLPALEAGGRSLDGILWIGGDGLALAQFGTRGGLYKPERPNPDPLLAFVDVKHGRILNHISLRSIPKAISAIGGPIVPHSLSAVQLSDGRLHAVFQWPSGFSMAWTQGGEPREVRLPKFPWGTTITLSPDGRKLLVFHALQANIDWCEANDDEVDRCLPPVPRTGKLAELIDVETGNSIWELNDTSIGPERYVEPAISPDGRYALIGIPERQDQSIALVSLANGRIVQTLARPTPTLNTVAFGADRRFFVIGGAYVATYEIAER